MAEAGYTILRTDEESTRKTGTWYVLSRYRSNGSWKNTSLNMIRK
jgi:hypothetical protein